MKKCCFTGHRHIMLTDKIKGDLYDTIDILINLGVRDFYAGGAIGWDTVCAMTIIKFRDEKYHDIKLHLILPCPEVEQTAMWSENQKKLYYDVIDNADSVQVLSDKYYKDCMKDRNQYLVNVSDCCICYYDKNKSATGTGQTVRMAVAKGLTVFNIFQR